ncbi:MAG: BMP family ABC transporter substrate-binding protein [Oscillospiraceae bacterium]
MKKLVAIMLTLAVAVSLTACGGDKAPEAKPDAAATPAADAAAPKEALKACIIVSNLGDKSFNDSADAGMKKAVEDFGIDYKCIEIGLDDSKSVPTLFEAADAGYDIIAFNNLSFGAAQDWLDENAATYPETTFLIYDEYMWENKNDNVVLLKYKQSESDFLAGALAGKMSKSGVVGFVGGMDVPVIADFLVGYIDGVLYANPKAKMTVSYTENWVDAAKGKELGLASINAGADFIHAVAGGSGNGALEAAQSKGIWGIGVDADQYELYKTEKPELAKSIITSSLKDVGTSLYTCIKEISEGTFKAGGDRWFGIEQNACGIAENENYLANVPADVQEYMKQVKADIASGKIKVSSYFSMTEEEYKAKVDAITKK